MKKLTLVLSLILVIFACKKEEEDTINYNLKSDYFTVQNASFVENTYPEESQSNAPIIDDIYGNSSIIPGGSNPIAISSNNMSNILVGVSEANGYFRLATSKNTSTKDGFIFYIQMNQNIEDEAFDIIIAIEDSNGNVSHHEIISVSLIEVGTGKLQVSCAWDQQNDVDLHLVEPSGEEIFYGSAVSTNGGELDLDSNAACMIDGVNNENITYSETDVVEAGEYIVRVDFWSNCGTTENTNFNVIAYYDGAIIGTTAGSNPYSGSFAPEEEDNGGLGDGDTVMKFVVPSSKSNNLTYRFNYPKTTKNTINLSPQKNK